jgi:hypothetical protein
MAWLHATPKPAEGTKRARLAERQSKLSRLDRLKADGITPQMPPNPAPHIVERLVEIGLSEATGMSASPLSWREILAWQEATGVPLTPWEARLIKRLSTAYLAEGRKAESENCPPPWRTKVTQREREVEQARLEMVLG